METYGDRASVALLMDIEAAALSSPFIAHPLQQERRVRLRIAYEEARCRRFVEHRCAAPSRFNFHPLPSEPTHRGSPTSSTPDVMASSAASTSSLVSGFSSMASFAGFESKVERAAADASDIDVLLSKMGRVHRREERAREQPGSLVLYRRGDNRYDAEKRRKVEDREEERREDIELVEDVLWKGITKRAEAEPLHHVLRFAAVEHRSRLTVACAEREAFARLMVKFSKLNLQLQAAFLRSFVAGGGNDDDLAANVQSTFVVPPVAHLDATALMLLRGAERSEREKRCNIQHVECHAALQLLEDHAVLVAALNNKRSVDAAVPVAARTPRPPAVSTAASSWQFLAGAAELFGPVNAFAGLRGAAPRQARARVHLAERRVLLRCEEVQRAALAQEHAATVSTGAAQFSSASEKWRSTFAAVGREPLES